ncbi:hypothetical protein FBUS_09776 [Fasciolopsis buskii]|uniref:Uncharacterized protein n=1 Tax=Fasciolopsis buskii TaxID=27845 RepID=A0A8E0VIU7_9TREM|nr:hypothetical protein FBUS_09776 [Fasciolopsis buski]
MWILNELEVTSPLSTTGYRCMVELSGDPT